MNLLLLALPSLISLQKIFDYLITWILTCTVSAVKFSNALWPYVVARQNILSTQTHTHTPHTHTTHTHTHHTHTPTHTHPHTHIHTK